MAWQCPHCGNESPDQESPGPWADHWQRSGYYRLSDILGDKRTGKPPLIPISKSTWWERVKKGEYPKPIKISAQITVWRVEDIHDLMVKFETIPPGNKKITRKNLVRTLAMALCDPCILGLNGPSLNPAYIYRLIWDKRQRAIKEQ